MKIILFLLTLILILSILVYNKNSKEMFQAKKDKTCNGKVDPPSVCPFDRAKEYCEHESESSAKFYKKECPVMCNTCPTTQAPTTQAPTMSPDFKQKFEDFIVQTNTKIELRKNFNTPSTQKLVTISNKLKDLETVYAKKDYVDDLVSSETQMNTYILRKYGNQYGVHQDELNDYLKKADLNSEDLQKLKTFYSEGYSKKKDYAKSEQLDDYATQEQLDSYARKKDLPNMDLYAKKEQLANYANKNDLNDTKINSLYRGLFKIGFLPGATGVTRIEKNFKKQLLNNYVKTKNLPNTDTEDLVKQEVLHNLEARAATQYELLSYVKQKQLEDYTKLKDLETIYAKEDDVMDEYERVYTNFKKTRDENSYVTNENLKNNYVNKNDFNSELYSKSDNFKNLEKQIKDSKKNTKEDIDSLKNNLNIIDKDLQGDLITNVDLLKENTNIMQNNLINFNNDVFSSINYSDNIPICINPDKNKNDTSFDYCSEHIKNKYISAQNFKKNK